MEGGRSAGTELCRLVVNLAYSTSAASILRLKFRCRSLSVTCDSVRSFHTTRFICPGSIQIDRSVTMRLCFVLSGRTSVLLECLPFSPFQEKYKELTEVL